MTSSIFWLTDRKLVKMEDSSTIDTAVSSFFKKQRNNDNVYSILPRLEISDLIRISTQVNGTPETPSSVSKDLIDEDKESLKDKHHHDSMLDTNIAAKKKKIEHNACSQLNHKNNRINDLELERSDLLSPEPKVRFQWFKRYGELVMYQFQHGHCYVSQKEPKYEKLGKWVSNQRKQYISASNGAKHPKSSERMKALEQMGWFCSKHVKRDIEWQVMYDELWEFKQQYGHCNVHMTNRHDKHLGEWVNKHRQEYCNVTQGRSSSLTSAHIAALNHVDLFSKQITDDWLSRYKLTMYVNQMK